MARAVVRNLVLLLLPLAIYLAWGWYRTRYVEKHGGEAPRLEQGPWPLLLFLGALLTIVSLAISALMQGGGPGTEYTPSHLENGELVPGRTTPIKP